MSGMYLKVVHKLQIIKSPSDYEIAA